ncbi:MAG TPA: GTP-binding protein [Archaeoglobus veneficus]|nr:GTP-binding protein [Archaeoglobus veneficus]
MSIKLGIPVIDDVIDIPTGKVVTYCVDPEVEGDVFLMQTLHENSEKCKCTLVITNMSPMVARNKFKEFGWNINFPIVDAYSGLVGDLSNEKYVVKDPSNAEELSKIVEDAIKENDLVAINSLSTMIDLCGERIVEYFKSWGKLATINNSVLVVNFVAWPYDEKIINAVKACSNAIVKIGGVHHRVIIGQYYGLVKVDWTEVKKKSILFKVIKPGGVRAYIPKILVTGPYNAGKTTFIHAISNKAVSVDRLGTTVALDHGYVEYKGFTIDIFGTPGQERFDPLLKMLGGEAFGVIVVVDSTKPEDFPRAKEMLEKTTKFGLPYVIAANKQDLPNALHPEEIRKRMSLPTNTPVISMSAINREGVYDVLDALLKILLG